MVKVNFQSNSTQVQKDNGKFLTNIPEVEEEIGEGIARDLVDAVKDSVEQKFNTFTGDLKNNVDYNKTKSGGNISFEVTANAYSRDGVNYAAWHEFAKSSHFVPFKIGNRVNQPITAWAKRFNQDDGIGITVTPMNQQEGSFMAPAVRRTIKETRRAVRSGKSPLREELAKAYSD